MKFNDDFAVFLRDTVRLNRARKDRLESHIDALESFIAKDEAFTDHFLAMIPAGSYAHRTIIKPVDTNDEFDADMLVYLKAVDGWEAKDYIEELYTRFRKSGTYRDKVSRKTRCLRITYAGDFHVDLVPYMERNGKHYITNRTEPEETGGYELSDPEKFNEWIDQKQRATHGTFRKSIQLLKYLRDHKNTFTCKSIILTTLTGDTINDLEASLSEDDYSDTSTAFVTILEKLAESLPAAMPAVMDPAETGDNFSDRYADEWDYENFRNQIRNYAQKARNALDETDRQKSIDSWRQIFGNEFKQASLAISTSDSAKHSLTVRASTERFIDEGDFGYPIQLQQECSVKVVGRCTGFSAGGIHLKNGFRKYDLSSNGNRVRKNRSLVFEAVVQVQRPYRVFWKVRNGGKEALGKEALRGEIREDEGQGVRVETTEYAGTHYVECYVIKDGAVVARDRQTVVVSKK